MSRIRPTRALTDSTDSAYLSHPCLQNLEPCLRFQFRLHQPCRKGASQALFSPMWAGNSLGEHQHRPGSQGWGHAEPGLEETVLFTSLLGHICQRQVLFIVPDSEGDSWSHHTAKKEICYSLTHPRFQILNKEASIADQGFPRICLMTGRFRMGLAGCGSPASTPELSSLLP